MGPLVGRSQVDDVWNRVTQLRGECELIHGGNRDFAIHGGDADKGAFFPTTLLYADQPLNSELPHSVEAFA